MAQLWPILFDRYGLEIAFAHRTFAWGSDARGKAHVHVVIVGLTHRDHQPKEKRLFSYADINGEPDESRHGALTAYLFDAGSVANRHLVVREEARPINGMERLLTGSQPIDNGNFIFEASERAQFLNDEPKADMFLHPLLGAEEHINGRQRWVLNLREATPAELREMPKVLERVRRVRAFRLSSKRVSTLRAADLPQNFGMSSIPTKPFLVIPKVSSERRKYIPLAMSYPPTVPTDLVFMLTDASVWQFGLLTSSIHMAWLSQIGGRLKSDYRYSIGLVYNTFPWPDATPAQRERVEGLAQAVLDARAAWPGSSLADLYDPDTVPANLRRAHAALDLAVDRLYRREPFASDRDRVEHLFGRYEALVNPLAREGAKQNRRVARKAAKAGDAG